MEPVAYAYVLDGRIVSRVNVSHPRLKTSKPAIFITRRLAERARRLYERERPGAQLVPLFAGEPVQNPSAE